MLRFSPVICLHHALLLKAIYAMSVQTVTIGDDGAWYNPMIASGAVGDIINFQFVGQAHSVTQSNYSQPCVAMEGGFHSGFAGTAIGGTSDNPMEWNLTITQDTTPIWYHCAALMPSPHCQAGMVGAINAGPPSALNAQNQSFEAFRSAAEIASVSPSQQSPPTSAILVGLGASATATPMTRSGGQTATPSAVPSSSSFSLTSSQIPTPSVTPTIASSEPASTSPITTRKTSKGALVGGVVGGIVAGAAIIVLLILLVRWRQRARRLFRERMSADGSSWLSSDGFTGQIHKPR